MFGCRFEISFDVPFFSRLQAQCRLICSAIQIEPSPVTGCLNHNQNVLIGRNSNGILIEGSESRPDPFLYLCYLDVGVLDWSPSIFVDDGEVNACWSCADLYC